MKSDTNFYSSLYLLHFKAVSSISMQNQNYMYIKMLYVKKNGQMNEI